MAESIFTSFVIVLTASLLATILSQRFRLPAALALIFLGVVVGPNVLGLVALDEFIHVFAEIGAVLLLFYVGIEFDFGKLLRVGVRATTFAVVKMLVIFVLLYQVALLFGLDALTAAIVAFMLSISSTAIIIKILEPQGLMKRKELRILIPQLIVEDVLAIVGITFLSLLDARQGVTWDGAIASIALSIAFLGVVYFVVRKLLIMFSSVLERYRSEESILFFSLTLCLVMSLLAAQLGLSAAIGAFLAGSLISSLRIGRIVEHTTRPLGLAFSSIFFMSVGMLVNPSLVIAGLPLFSALIVATMIAAFIASYLASRFVGLSHESATFSAASLLVLGEFTLLLAREAVPHASIDVIGLASLAVLASTIVSTLAVSRFPDLAAFLQRVVPSGVESVLSSFSRYSGRVVTQFEVGGPLHSAFMAEASERRSDLKRVVAAGAVVASAAFLLPPMLFTVAQYEVSFLFIAATILAGVLFYSFVRLVQSFSKLLGMMGHSLRVRRAKAAMRSFEYNLLMTLVFLTGFFTIPSLTTSLQMPAFFALMQFPFLLIAIVFAWAGVKAFASVGAHAA